MVMITRGCEKKPQGVVSVTRGEFSVLEVADVARLYVFPQRRSRSGGPHAAADGYTPVSSDGFSSASSHVATLAWQ